MISEAPPQRRYRSGDRVRLVDTATSEVGTVTRTGAVLNEDGSRTEHVEVLWPIGATPSTRGFDGRRRRWHSPSDLEQVAA